MKKDILSIAILSGLTILSGMTLSRIPNGAYAEIVDEISVLVEPSCTLDSIIESEHVETLQPGTIVDGFGQTKLDVTCNDINGWALYAIGYGGDTEGNTNLSMTSGATTYTIPTGVGGINSYWAMKLFANTPTPTDVVTSGYRNYHVVPSNYDKVASSDINTSLMAGSSISTTYEVYAEHGQAAGTYHGKVKYLLVHPSTTVCPEGYEMKDGVCTKRILTLSEISTMQEMAPEICAASSVGETAQLKDTRDNKYYYVAKLKDGKCWMLDNLALDLTDDTVLNGLDVNNTDIDTTKDPDALAALKGTKLGTTSDKYATAKVALPNGSSSYSAPLVNMYIKDVVPSDTLSTAGGWKIGGYYNYCAASAGSYCYGDGTSAGTSSGNATSSICPKGWRMPTGASAGEFKALYDKYSGATPSQYEAFRNALHLPLSGEYSNGGYSFGGGTFWSSTRDYYGEMYVLSANTSSINPTLFGYSRNRYISVRCVAQ